MAALQEINRGFQVDANSANAKVGDTVPSSGLPAPSVRIQSTPGGSKHPLNRRGSFQLAGRVPKTRRRSILATALQLTDISRRGLEEVREEVFALVWRGKAFSLTARVARMCILALLYISLMSLITETVDFDNAPSLVEPRNVGTRTVEYVFCSMMLVESLLRLWTADLEPYYPAAFVLTAFGPCICVRSSGVSQEPSATDLQFSSRSPVGQDWASTGTAQAQQIQQETNVAVVKSPFSDKGSTAGASILVEAASQKSSSTPRAAEPAVASSSSAQLLQGSTTRRASSGAHSSMDSYDDDNDDNGNPNETNDNGTSSKTSTDPELRKLALAANIRKQRELSTGLDPLASGMDSNGQPTWREQMLRKKEQKEREMATARALVEDDGTCRGCCLHTTYYVILPRVLVLGWPSMVFDMLLLAPAVLHMMGVVDVFESDSQISNWVRMGRAVRLFKFVRYTPSLAALFAVFSIKSEELLTSLLISSSFILIFAFAIHAAEHQSNPEDFPDLGTALYHSVISITSVGYGDLAPITTQGRFVTALLVVLGTSFYSLPAAILATGFLEWRSEQRAKRTRLLDKLFFLKKKMVMSTAMFRWRRQAQRETRALQRWLDQNSRELEKALAMLENTVGTFRPTPSYLQLAGSTFAAETEIGGEEDDQHSENGGDTTGTTEDASSADDGRHAGSDSKSAHRTRSGSQRATAARLSVNTTGAAADTENHYPPRQSSRVAFQPETKDPSAAGRVGSGSNSRHTGTTAKQLKSGFSFSIQGLQNRLQTFDRIQMQQSQAQAGLPWAGGVPIPMLGGMSSMHPAIAMQQARTQALWQGGAGALHAGTGAGGVGHSGYGGVTGAGGRNDIHLQRGIRRRSSSGSGFTEANTIDPDGDGHGLQTHGYRQSRRHSVGGDSIPGLPSPDDRDHLTQVELISGPGSKMSKDSRSTKSTINSSAPSSSIVGPPGSHDGVSRIAGGSDSSAVSPPGEVLSASGINIAPGAASGSLRSDGGDNTSVSRGRGSTSDGTEVERLKLTPEDTSGLGSGMSRLEEEAALSAGRRLLVRCGGHLEVAMQMLRRANDLLQDDKQVASTDRVGQRSRGGQRGLEQGSVHPFGYSGAQVGAPGPGTYGHAPNRNAHGHGHDHGYGHGHGYGYGYGQGFQSHEGAAEHDASHERPVPVSKPMPMLGSHPRSRTTGRRGSGTRAHVDVSLGQGQDQPLLGHQRETLSPSRSVYPAMQRGKRAAGPAGDGAHHPGGYGHQGHGDQFTGMGGQRVGGITSASFYSGGGDTHAGNGLPPGLGALMRGNTINSQMDDGDSSGGRFSQLQNMAASMGGQSTRSIATAGTVTMNTTSLTRLLATVRMAVAARRRVSNGKAATEPPSNAQVMDGSSGADDEGRQPADIKQSQNQAVTGSAPQGVHPGVPYREFHAGDGLGGISEDEDEDDEFVGGVDVGGESQNE